MKQSRIMSLVESLTNVVVGYGIAVVTQIVVFPLFGLSTTIAENMVMGAIFTVVSIVRSYSLRRLFEAIRQWSCGLRQQNAGLHFLSHFVERCHKPVTF